MAKFFKLSLVALVLAAAAFGGVHLFGSSNTAQALADGASAPAMEVETATIEPQSIQLWKNFSGHLVAVDQAEIRPQVSGRINEIRFTDGQHVKKGDVLIVIDPRPFEANLNQARAALKAAQTQSDLAEKEYQRAVKLIDSDAISRSMLDERTNNRDTAAAAIQGARAAVESAKIDLDYAFVKAPIDGKISRAEITEGNLVQAGVNAPLLTSIVSDKKIYVDFEVDERTYISSVKNSGDEALAKIPVKLRLANTDAQYNGVVHSFDNRIDQASGTIRARAILDNEDGVLLPGMTATVLMGENSSDKKILVTERAIGTDQDRKFVYVVDGDSKATYREVKLGESVDGQRVILSGLESGEQVITEGLVRIRPGAAVKPKTTAAEAEAQMPAEEMSAEEEQPAEEPQEEITAEEE